MKKGRVTGSCKLPVTLRSGAPKDGAFEVGEDPTPMPLRFKKSHKNMLHTKYQTEAFYVNGRHFSARGVGVDHPVSVCRGSMPPTADKSQAQKPARSGHYTFFDCR